MAAAAYTTDLTLMDAAESLTGWAESTASGWTSIFSPVNDSDDFIQNAKCNSSTVKTGVGILFWNQGSGITLSTDDAVLIWAKWDAAPLLATEANGGIRVAMGSSLSVFYAFDYLGSDSYTYGGWRNLAMGDPDDAGITPDYTVGGIASGFTKQYFGWAYNAPTSVPSKGNPYKVDALRYGRCDLRVNGGDVSNGYATFAGMALNNDYNDGTNGYNRWGLFQATGGTNYLWKGLITLGYTSAIDFRDSNRNITIDNVKHVTSAFNKISVEQATSNVEWTNINISALGTVSRGTFVATADATIVKDTCVFTDMLTFTYQSNSSVDNCTYRRCDQIDIGGGALTNCVIEGSTNASAVVCTNLSEITDSHFIGDSTGHAVNLGTIGSTQSMDWKNTFDTTTYATVDGSTGNEVILVSVSSGFTLTINVPAGYTKPTIYNTGAGTVLVVENPVTLTVTVKDSGTGNAIQNAAVTIKPTNATGPLPFEESVTITQTTGTATVSHTAHGFSVGQKVEIAGANENDYNRIKEILTVPTVDSYTYTVPTGTASPATGTITSTAVIIDGLTDVSGQITDTRPYASNQPIAGTSKKGTSEPVYKSTPISNTIDSTSGLSITTLMNPD